MTERSLGVCFAAEALGTFVLVFFGCGAVHSAVLTGSLSGLWQVGIVWGLAVMAAIYIVGPISGAHIDPAITVGLASWGLFPTGRVLPYVGAQVVGAFLAAGVLFTIYHGELAAKEQQKGVVRGEAGSEITAMCYGEYFPNPGPMASGDTRYDASEHARLNARLSEFQACLAEVVATAILALVVCATTNVRSPLSPGNFAAAFIGLAVAGLICVIAPLTQACLNPARDFGPRLFTALAGWGSIGLPGPRPTGFLTVYIVSPCLGAIIGVGLYQRVLQRWMGEE